MVLMIFIIDRAVVQNPDDIIVIVGDFNADKGSGAYNLFEASGF